MTPFDYEFLCRFLKERSGLMLSPEKEYIVENRLMPVARRNKCTTTAELIQLLRMSVSEAFRVEVTEAMMNNESLFFRDKVPFERLRDTALPNLMKKRAGRRQIRIWCAAASTGQEPYSVAMLLDERPDLKNWQIDIVATDISNDALEQGKAGTYSQFEVQRGLPIHMLLQHFEQVGDQWRISQRLRKMVQFRQFNLLSDFLPLGTFDIVLCRNVLIYFDHATKLDVLERIRHVIADDGYLVLGAAETVVGLGDLFMPIPEKRTLYQPRPRAPLVPDLKPVSGGAKVA